MFCVGAAMSWRNDVAWGNSNAFRLEAQLSTWLSNAWNTAKSSVFSLGRALGLANGEDNAIQMLVAPAMVYAGLNQHTHILSDAERIAAARHARASDAERYRASRVLLRTALSQGRTDIAPDAWSFAESEHGKPQVTGEQNAHFNISHTEEGLALAVSRFPVGIDVEDLTRDVNESLFRTMLTPAEHRRLMRCSPAKRSRQFLKIWSMKEAYAKLLGLGHSLDFAKIEVSLGKGRLIADGNFSHETSRLVSRSVQFHSFAWAQEKGEQWVVIAHQASHRTRVHTHILPTSNAK
jgi:phosphopantetheine--protein transferase-like protein